MVSIQSLMDDMPYHNEPGFEKEALSGTPSPLNPNP